MARPIGHQTHRLEYSVNIKMCNSLSVENLSVGLAQSLLLPATARGPRFESVNETG